MHRELLLFQCVSAAQTWVALHRQWELQQHPRRIPHRSKNMGHRAPLGPCQWTKVVVQNPKCIQVRVVRFTLEWPWWSRGPCSNLQCLKAKQPQGKELRKNNVCSCLGGGGDLSPGVSTSDTEYCQLWSPGNWAQSTSADSENTQAHRCVSPAAESRTGLSLPRLAVRERMWF